MVNRQENSNRFDTSVAALVLNFGKNPFHQGSLGAIRSLGSAGIPVFAVQRSSIIPSGASRYLSGKFVWKMDSKDTGSFLGGMSVISRTLSRPTVLVPTDDLSAILIAEHAAELPSEFRFARPAPEIPRSVSDKRSLYQLCQKLDVACPPTFFPGSREELLGITHQMRFPVVVKVIEPWLVPKGIKSTALIPGPEQLLTYCDSFERQVPATALMVQKRIEPTVEGDWFVHGYCDSRSNPIVLFTGIKLRSYPAFAGRTTLARSVRNDDLKEEAAKLLRAIGYQGIMDLDFRLDRDTGRYNLLDFNPRVGAQFRLFRTSDDIDVVRALHLDLTERVSQTGPQVDNRTFIAEFSDLLASRAYWRSGDLSASAWWRSVQRIDEAAWYTRDDPMPFVLMSVHLPFRAVSRALGLDDLGNVATGSLPTLRN